jgi:hypothetical protein
MYDTTAAGYARYRAREAMAYGDTIRVDAWLAESWRLWDGRSNLRVDPTGLTYCTNDYPHHLSYPDQYYFDQEAEIKALLDKAEALVAESDYIFGFGPKLVTVHEAIQLVVAQDAEICEEPQQ